MRQEGKIGEAKQMALADGLSLVAGTVLYDGGNLFSQTKQMANVALGAVVSVHPDDASKMGIEAGTELIVRNSHGALTLAARLDPHVKPGTVWIPESLPQSPVGALLNGSDVETVEIVKK